jgi:2-hydroxychromene-2-carboxylate isomerase
MAKTVDFIFDFASPNAYLAHRALPLIADRTGAIVKSIPCLLGGIFKATNNRPPMVTFGKVKGKLEYETLETKRFIKRHGLSQFKMNMHFPVNSLMMMRGALVAQADGRLSEYIEVCMQAMWEQNRNMADADVFAGVLALEGFDGPEYLKRIQKPAVKAKLIKNTEAAVARGVFGVPTFFVGKEMFFGKERLWQVEEALSN